MIFKRFNPDNFKTDMCGYITETEVIFVDYEDVVRFGCIKEDYIGDGKSKYLIISDGNEYNVENHYICKVSVENWNE